MDLMKVVVALLSLAILIGLANLYVGYKIYSSAIHQGDKANTRASVEFSKGHSEGSDAAPVTIVEFSDFQCPFCARFYFQTLPQIRKNYIETGKVRFVYKHFPLDNLHPMARKAAEASECAGEQGKFWEYHDKLFENQQRFSVEYFKQLAAEIGLDTAKFNSCLDSGKYASKVESDLQEGMSKGVTGTPTFFINGRKVVGAQPYSVFQQLIDSSAG